MANPNQLTRMCISCGIEKPISSFLQLTGAKGTTYGNICATCRSANANGRNAPKTTDAEDETSSGSGLRIDAKAKEHADKEKKQHTKKINELYDEEKQQDRELEKKTLETKALESLEKNKRDKFNEAKKKSTLFTKPITTSHERQINIKQVLETSQQQQQEVAKQEELTKTIDSSDSAHVALEKNLSSTFRSFRDRLGGGARINLLDRSYQEKNMPKESADPLIKKIDQNWGPSSRKR